jgi:hypothetical protein
MNKVLAYLSTLGLVWDFEEQKPLRAGTARRYQREHDDRARRSVVYRNTPSRSASRQVRRRLSWAS